MAEPTDTAGTRAGGARRPRPARPTRDGRAVPPPEVRRRADDASRRRPPAAEPGATRGSGVPADRAPDPLPSEGWTAFFRPVRSSRSGTMPAGMVLFVIVAGLVVALFMTAPSISRKADGRRNNAEWRRGMASALATVSRGLKLDAPAESLASATGEWLGHSGQSQLGDVTTEELLAQVAAQPDVTAPPPSATDAPDGSGAPTSSPPPTLATPKLRAPTPDKPLNLWVGGDSTSYELGVALENISVRSQLFKVTTDARPSTGLVRDDYFNWPAHLVRDVTPILDPDIFVIQFGANDSQNMVSPQKTLWEVGSPEWLAEYRKRVGDTMDLLRGRNGRERLVIWVGEPPMGPNAAVKGIPAMNYIYATEAARRPWVRYFDAWGYFSDAEGNYAKSLPNADGQVRVMRANDNIHMSAAGGTRLAWAVWQVMAQLVDLSASQVAPEPAQVAPAEVGERPAVPPAEGQAPV